MWSYKTVYTTRTTNFMPHMAWAKHILWRSMQRTAHTITALLFTLKILPWKKNEKIGVNFYEPSEWQYSQNKALQLHIAQIVRYSRIWYGMTLITLCIPSTISIVSISNSTVHQSSTQHSIARIRVRVITKCRFFKWLFQKGNFT